MNHSWRMRVDGRNTLSGLARRAMAKARQVAGSRGACGQAGCGEDVGEPGGHVDDRGPVFELGFHGDAHLLALIDRLLPGVDAFVETGANLGSTTRYVASRFPDLPVHACEIGLEAAEQARRHVAGLSNAKIYCQGSPEFIHWLHDARPELRETLNFYFLDAHGHGYEWPLAGELAFLSTLERGVVLVDDCRVPGHPEFKHSQYGGTECTLDYIARSLSEVHAYEVVLPDYRDHTSPHHPLTGYVLIAFETTVLREAVGDDRRFQRRSLPSASPAAA